VLLDHGSDHVVIAMHEVDDGFDTGKLLALSDKVYVPAGATVVDLHKQTSPVAAKFFVDQLGKMLAMPHSAVA
jgi:methionyl-tRNA formyltransferase